MPGNWAEMRDVLARELPASEKLVLLALRIRCGSNGSCWPSQGLLAQDTGLSERHIRTITGNLESRGLLRTTWRRGIDGRHLEDHLNTGTGFRHLAEIASGNCRNSVPRNRKFTFEKAATASAEEKKEEKKKEERKGARVGEPDGSRAPEEELIAPEQLAELRRSLDQAATALRA